MQVVNDKVVAVTLPSTVVESALATIPKFKVSNDYGAQKDALVFWGYDEMAQLATCIDEQSPNPNLPKVMSPILRDYKWPGIYKPFDHQKDTASFLSLRRRAFCFNEAGTGKTSAAIWAADYLMELGKVKRVLVISPLSIMYPAWRDDIFKTAMHRSCGVAHGTTEKRKKIIAADFDFVVINFDGVQTVFNEIKAANFDLIIVDEANAYKTTSTHRWKTLAKLLTPDTWLWMMTGTPAAQSPIDAFGLARLIAPTRVPKYSTAWRDKVQYQVSRFKWENRNNWLEQVSYALQPAIRYTKKECLDLPDVIYQTRHIPLTPAVERAYKNLKQQMLIEASGEQISAVNAAASLTKLLQISGGAVYTDKHKIVEFDASPRLKALKETIDETLNKVVVFVPYTHTIDVVRSYLEDEGITTEVIQGSVSPHERTNIIKRFQEEPNPRVIIIQPQAAAHGITLTAADTAVFWSPVMSVEIYLQCVARIDRVGQKSKMTVVHLQGSDVEKRMYKMLQGKVDNHHQLVDLYRQELEDEDYE